MWHSGMNKIFYILLSLSTISSCYCPPYVAHRYSQLLYGYRDTTRMGTDTVLTQKRIMDNPIVSAEIHILPMAGLWNRTATIDSIGIDFRTATRGMLWSSLGGKKAVSSLSVTMVYKTDTIPYKVILLDKNIYIDDEGLPLFDSSARWESDPYHLYTAIAYCEHPKDYMRVQRDSATDFMNNHSILLSGVMYGRYFFQPFVSYVKRW